MIGATLTECRSRIDSLAVEDGAYSVVCGRTGEQPVPVAGKRFAGREAGRTGVRATQQYRPALRRYDPQVPHYELIVCQVPLGVGRPSGRASVPTHPEV